MNEKNQDIISEIYTKINEYIGNGSITIVNILSVCLYTMKCIESYRNLSGNEKKNIVIECLRNTILQKNGDVNILEILPSFIDTSIGIEKGDIQINIKPEKCCLTLCQLLKNKIDFKNKV